MVAKRPVLAVVAAGVVAGLAACGSGGDSRAATPTALPDPPTTTAPSQAMPRAKPSTSVRTIVSNLHVPWGIAFLPDGDALVSERTTGKILRVRRGSYKTSTAMKVPGVNLNSGEGGLLGLAVSPHYAIDHLVYAYLTTADDNRVVRFKLGHKPKPILTGLMRGEIHNGGRIAFGPDGKLYVTVGETGNTALAQDKSVRNGKILRIEPDGSIPADNPFKGSPIWTYGHRNPQGLAWDSAGRLWSSELGQNTYDEVNLIEKGKDYGWPIVEGIGDTHGGQYTNPLVEFRTSDASPSGDAIIGRTLYVATLQGGTLYRMRIDGTKLGKPSKLLAGRFGRLRTPIKAPDGSLWISTSNRDGRGSPKAGDDRIVRYKP